MSVQAFLFKTARQLPPDISASPVGRYQGIEVCDLDPTGLSSLQTLITGIDSFELSCAGNYKPLCSASSHGPWLIAVPPELSQSLKRLASSEIDQLLDSWCHSTEMHLYNWTPEKATIILDWLINTEINEQEQLMLYMQAG